MIFKVLLRLLFSCSFIVAAKNKWECAGYYWRDYIGKTPYVAVPAGIDHEGNPRYIGLVYTRGFELLPATILAKTGPLFSNLVPTRMKLYSYELENRDPGVAETTAYEHITLTSSLFVKILCSPYKKAFEWIHVESKNLHDYENRTLIPGGSELGESLYIGRAFRNGDPIIGKIFRHERDNRGLTFTDGKSFMTDLTYEVLAYDCNKMDGPGVDIRLGKAAGGNHTVLTFY